MCGISCDSENIYSDRIVLMDLDLDLVDPHYFLFPVHLKTSMTVFEKKLTSCLYLYSENALKYLTLLISYPDT